jgi:hypothetical protein
LHLLTYQSSQKKVKSHLQGNRWTDNVYFYCHSSKRFLLSDVVFFFFFCWFPSLNPKTLQEAPQPHKWNHQPHTESRPESTERNRVKFQVPSVAALTWTQGSEARGPQVQGQAGLHSETPS